MGVLQRFGVVALTMRERKDILNSCIYSRPHVLEICVARLTEMQVRCVDRSLCLWSFCRGLCTRACRFSHLPNSSNPSPNGASRRSLQVSE